MRTQRVLLGTLAMLVTVVTHAQAQIARGVVVEETSGAPIHGAFVQLLNEQGQRIAGVLSGQAGEFVFRTPAGRYALRAERIGHSSVTVPVFDLAERELREFRLTLAVQALRLPEITIRGESRCMRRPESSAQTARVWEEARKALNVAAWMETDMPATFRYRMIERDLDLELRETSRPRIRFNASAGTRAFSAAHPDSLEAHGYVQDRMGETYLYGPDAELLLSESFINQHCFRLIRRDNRRDMIGLAFEPVSGRRLPDIQGVLWLDEKSAELRFIEFGYTGRDHYGDARYAGGRTEFKQLANGAWIVSNWYIRGPRLGRAHNMNELRVVGTYERGGDVLDAQVSGLTASTLVPRTSVSGFVFDNVHSRPLAGARVYLSGTPFWTTADVAGRFQLDSIPSGVYFIAFEHPRLDSLPAFPEPTPLQVDSVPVSDMALMVPAAERMIDDVCPPEERLRVLRAARDTSAANRGLIFGTVDHPEKVFNAIEIGLTWRRVFAVTGAATASLDQLSMRPHSVAVSVAEDGRYFICGVPIDHPLVIEVLVRDSRMQRDSLRLMPPGLMRRDFTLRRP